MIGRGDILPFLGCIVGLGLAASSAQGSFSQSIANPSYFYPPSFWPQLQAAAPVVGIAIVNPASGPGTTQDPNYVTQVSNTKAAGILVLGYVYTSYGARPVAQVEADVDTFYSLYDIDGIFFDEASNDCADQPYYAALDAYVKAKGGVGKTIINPGTTAPECFITAADIILNFEDTYDSYLTWTPAGWESGYPAARFWHLVHTTPLTKLASAVLLSQSRNAGWVYVTPDRLSNPWDTLPSEPYWSVELSYVRPSTPCSPLVVRPKLAIARLDTPPGDDRFQFSGQATLASPPDPIANGVRLKVSDTTGVIADVTIPPGAHDPALGTGWLVNGAMTKWTFIDDSPSPPGGITKVIINNKSARTPGLFTFLFKGSQGSFPTSPANLPLSATVELEPGNPSGPCVTSSFPGPKPDCGANGSGSAVKCR